LKHLNFDTSPSWEELCEILHFVKSPARKWYGSDYPNIALYPEDLFRYIIKNNFNFRMIFCDDEWQESLVKAPIMVLLDGILEEFPDEMHWVVLLQKDKENISYFDPWDKTEKDGLKIIPFDIFKKTYTGIACQIL
jgi:hypothetical protein